MDHQHSRSVITNTELYESDFYEWCLATAQLVRAGQWEAIDPEALAEELEGLARSEKRELESRLETLLVHLLKWQYQPLRRVESHSWYDTILEQRSQLHRLLRDNPRFRRQVPDLVLELYPDARKRAERLIEPSVQQGLMPPREPVGSRMQENLPDVPMLLLPRECPWTAA